MCTGKCPHYNFLSNFVKIYTKKEMSFWPNSPRVVILTTLYENFVKNRLTCPDSEKTLASTSIKHRPDAFASDRCLIDVDSGLSGVLGSIGSPRGLASFRQQQQSPYVCWLLFLLPLTRFAEATGKWGRVLAGVAEPLGHLLCFVDLNKSGKSDIRGLGRKPRICDQ